MNLYPYLSHSISSHFKLLHQLSFNLRKLDDSLNLSPTNETFPSLGICRTGELHGLHDCLPFSWSVMGPPVKDQLGDDPEPRTCTNNWGFQWQMRGRMTSKHGDFTCFHYLSLYISLSILCSIRNEGVWPWKWRKNPPVGGSIISMKILIWQQKKLTLGHLYHQRCDHQKCQNKTYQHWG